MGHLCAFVCLSVCLSACLSACLPVCLSVCLPVCLSVCLPVCLSVCQVAIERKETLFIDDPTQFPGLEKNEDYVKFGYGYYLGAPWAVGDTRGGFGGRELDEGRRGVYSTSRRTGLLRKQCLAPSV